MTTKRLRKAFRYPADNSDEDELPHLLDEEGLCKPLHSASEQAKVAIEQERLIAKMRQDNETRDQQFLVCSYTNTWHIILMMISIREYFLRFP